MNQKIRIDRQVILKKTLVFILIFSAVQASGCLKRSIERPKPPDEIDTKIAYHLSYYKNTKSAESFGEILRFGSRAVPALAGALSDDDADVRRLSVRLLCMLDPSNPKLPYMLNDPSADTAVETALGTGACCTENAAPLLISAMLKNGSDVFSTRKNREIVFKDKNTAEEYLASGNMTAENKVRLACAWALLRYDAPWITEMLFENATEDADFKWLAAAVSGKCAYLLDESLLLRLTAFSIYELPYIQAQAAEALGEARNPAVLTPLLLLLDSPDKETADSAAIAIQKILALIDIEREKSALFPEDINELRNQLKSWRDENREACKKDFAAFVKKASCGLVIEGRITGINQAEPPTTPASWAIEIGVINVKRGKFSEKTFKLQLHAGEEPLAVKGGPGEFIFIFYISRHPDGRLSLDWIENKN